MELDIRIQGRSNIRKEWERNLDLQMSNGKIIYIFIHYLFWFQKSVLTVDVPQQAKGIEFEEETEYKQLIIGFF